LFHLFRLGERTFDQVAHDGRVPVIRGLALTQWLAHELEGPA
jgi:hypothetical protein